MTSEEIFKKNFPQYVTEKGVCLSPFWDLFDAGVEVATAELAKNYQTSRLYEELKKNLKSVIKSDMNIDEKIDLILALCQQTTNDENKELKEQLTKAKEIIEELSKSLFLAKGIIRDLIDDTVDFKESKERAIYCYEQEKFDTYKEAVEFLKELSE